MLTALSRIAVAAVIGATAAGVGTLYAAVEPVQGTAHAAVVEEDQPGWDCHTMGNRVCGSAYTCWVEKATDPATAEGLCGPAQLRPAGSLDLGQEVTLNGHVWVATVTGLEPVEEV